VERKSYDFLFLFLNIFIIKEEDFIPPPF
jgi:hypothetical protein